MPLHTVANWWNKSDLCWTVDQGKSLVEFHL